MNKALSVLGMLLVSFGFGYWLQAYSLPRIGLHAMDIGQYLVVFGFYVVAHILIAICKAAGGNDDQSVR